MNVNNDPKLYPKIHDYGVEIHPNSTVGMDVVGPRNAVYYAKNPTPQGVTFDEFMRDPKAHIGVDHQASIGSHLKAAKRDVAFAKDPTHSKPGRVEAAIDAFINTLEAIGHWFKVRFGG